MGGKGFEPICPTEASPDFVGGAKHFFRRCKRSARGHGIRPPPRTAAAEQGGPGGVGRHRIQRVNVHPYLFSDASQKRLAAASSRGGRRGTRPDRRPSGLGGTLSRRRRE